MRYNQSLAAQKTLSACPMLRNFPVGHPPDNSNNHFNNASISQDLRRDSIGRGKSRVFMPSDDLISPGLFLIFYVTLLTEVFIRSPSEVMHFFRFSYTIVSSVKPERLTKFGKIKRLELGAM
jgi:hypothetical protein